MIQMVIADDENRICSTIKYVVSEAFPQVRLAAVFNNGRDLQDYVAANHVDLLITDIEMPEMNGLEIVHRMREQGNNCYVIMITAYRDFDYAIRALNSSVNAFLTKPFSSSDLEREVRKAIESILEDRQHVSKQWNVFGNLIRAVCSSLQWQTVTEITLCQGTKRLDTLSCSELVVCSENGYLLIPEQEELLVRDIKTIGETDTLQQSVFFLEKNKANVSFLIFADASPNLSFTGDIICVVERYTGTKASFVWKTFESFAAYCAYLEFNRVMDSFFKVLALKGRRQAETQIREYIDSCDTDKRKKFGEHLTKEQRVQLEGSEVQDIMKSVSAIVDRTLAYGSSNYLINATMEHIKKNYMNPALSLDSVADALAVSGGYLSRLFKSKTGQNFSEYLQTIRMDNAQHLLKTTALPISDIAVASGYNNATYFRMLFKSRFGMTPRQYRQN